MSTAKDIYWGSQVQKFTRIIIEDKKKKWKVVNMKDSKRINELIFYLTNNNEFIQAEEIASFLHVSKKTVYRLVKKINDENSAPLIISQRGAGYKLNYQYYMQNKENLELMNSSLTNVSPVERRNRIMKQLLLISPQSMKESEAFGKYYVSNNVRLNDEQVMKSILEKYQLKLEIKNGYIKIKGSEINIRNAIKELIDDREIVDLRQFVGNKDFNSKYDVQFVLKEIEKIEDELQTTLPYPYNVNLFSHIYILISRLRKTGSKTDLADNDLNKEIKHNLSFYQISKDIVEDISNYLDLKLPETEANSIFEYLISSRFDNDILQTNMSTEVQRITAELIDSVSEKTGCSFVSINNELEKHIEPLIKRLRNNIHVNNNLLEQIKMEYQDIFEAIKSAASEVFSEHNLAIPEDNEIGYITLYFAQAIEIHPRRIRVIVMCSTGIGTSELLRLKVKNTFSNFDIVAVTSSNDLSYSKKDADLIISTVKVSEKIDIPSIVVSALFTKQDIEMVQQKVNQLRGETDEES